MYDYVVMLAMSEPYQIDNLFPVLFLGERKVRPEIKPFKNNICHLLKTMTGTRVSDMVNCISTMSTVQGNKYPIGCGLSYQVGK